MRELTESKDRVRIRPARRADAKAILDLVVGLARFERLDPPASNSRARLVDDIFGKKLVRVLIAVAEGECIGYALYFYTYSSFLARPTLYLEDIFVRESRRHVGVGKALFMRCVREAELHRCGRMEWTVLAWNKKARNFYGRLGAKNLGDLRTYRLDQKSMQALLKSAD